MMATTDMTVVVTGGTRGLGYETSLEFARRGYRVLALYHADEQAALRLDRAFASEGLAGRSFQHDVSAIGSESAVWSQIEITGAASLILIHNASAAFEPKPLHLLTWEDFSTSIDVALKGCWQCALGVLRPMLKNGGGTIVTVSTTALSAQPPKGFAAYLAAKAALRAFTQSLAAEYGERGIRAFTVSPGFMETSLTERWHVALRQAMLKSSDAADPARVAEKICMLVEDSTLPCRGENYDV